MFTAHLKSYKHSIVISFSWKFKRMIAAWHPPLGALESKSYVSMRGLNHGREKVCKFANESKSQPHQAS